MDYYLKLAKETIEKYIKTNKIPLLPKKIPQEMLSKKAGAFVSIHTKDGPLRGCIGTFLPTRPNIALEIITNAISSATQDPRFPPITEKELSDFVYSVDVLSKPKTISNRKAIDPKKYGLIVSTPDGRRGLLLPHIPGVDTPEQQIKICCQKAGIEPKEKVKLETFIVERHGRV